MRRTALLAAGTLAAGTLVTTSPPASATGPCVGVAVNLHLSKPLFHPGLGPVQTDVTGSVTTNVGSTCSIDLHLATAQCGNSSGTGTIDDGTSTASFNLVTAGSVGVITGGAVGTVTLTPNALLGDSCTSGADDFHSDWILCVTVRGTVCV